MKLAHSVKTKPHGSNLYSEKYRYVRVNKNNLDYRRRRIEEEDTTTSMVFSRSSRIKKNYIKTLIASE